VIPLITHREQGSKLPKPQGSGVFAICHKINKNCIPLRFLYWEANEIFTL